MYLTPLLLAVALAQVPPLDAEPNAPTTDTPVEAPAFAPMFSPARTEADAEAAPADAPIFAPAEISPQAEPAELVPEAEPLETEADAPTSTEPSAPPLATPAAPALNRLSTEEMVAEAIVLPPGGSIEGKPLKLSDALARATDPSRQQAIVHAYWQLVEAVAVHGYGIDYKNRVAQLGATGTATVDQPAGYMPLLAIEASAKALVRESELAVVAAQHRLAAAASLPTSAALPLPADPPHVGTYKTRFDQMFATRTPPAMAVLIDRTLPIESQAVESRAEAVRAAEEAYRAADRLQEPGSAESGRCASLAKRSLQQRTAMIASVCRYNRDIADYALAVSKPGTDGKALVRMLIKVPDEPLQPVIAPADGRVEHAGLDEPIRRTPPRRIRPSRNVPTRAVRPGTEKSPTDRNVPTLAPRPGVEAKPLPKNVPTPAKRPEEKTATPKEAAPVETPWRSANPVEKKEEAATPASHDEPLPIDPSRPVSPSPRSIVPARPIVPIEPEAEAVQPPTSRVEPEAEEPAADATEDDTSDTDEPAPTPAKKSPQSRTANKPSVESEGDSAWRAPGSPRSDTAKMLGLPPANRAKQLTTTLHGNRKLPDDAGQPVTLSLCVQKCSPNNRAATVKQYWLTMQRAAEYQVMLRRVEMLDALATEQGPVDVNLRLSAREAAAAAADEARVAMIQSQFQLARLIGGDVTNRPLPLPSTLPHSGSYVLNLKNRPRQLTESWSFRRLAATIPVLHENILDRSDAVAKADAARVLGENSTAAPIDAIDEQTEQTLAFLRTLTEYNGAIVDYAMAVLGPTASGERLVSALVIQ